MPELPEVQITVDYLQKKLVGLKFKDVWTDWPKMFKEAGGFGYFKKTIKNRKILSVRRRAKFIVIDTEGAYSIFIHQKISGHLLYGRWAVKSEIRNPKSETEKSKTQNSKQIWISVIPGSLKDDPKNRFIRTVFFLSNGNQLAFSDLRRFGKIVLVKGKEIEEIKEIKKLGPEPLEIDFKEFKSLFRGKRGRIKQVLMDPFFIAGIGNIYSDEILWDAGLHPLSRTENLSDSDLKKIYDSTQKILKKAIKAGGTSIEDYRKPSGEKGEYQNYTKAYHQTGKKCSRKAASEEGEPRLVSRRDGGVIRKIKLGDRSAHFCPVHQLLK